MTQQTTQLVTRAPGDIERKVKAVWLTSAIGPIVTAGVAAFAAAAFPVLLPDVTADCLEQVTEGLSTTLTTESLALIAGGAAGLQGLINSLVGYMTKSERRPDGQ